MNMKKAAGDLTVERLIDEGWMPDHTALVNRYRYAGTVTEMRPHKGQEYCRVHHGRCIGKHNYQITTVMRRDTQ